MYSLLGKINDSILASLCETNITDWYLEEMPASLFWRLFEHRTFWHHQDFELEIETKAALQIADKIINVQPGVQKIYVPPITVACYHTTKISTWRKDMDLDVWLRNGVKSLLRTIDIEAVKVLLAADESLVCEKNHQDNILVMSPATCERQFGITVDEFNNNRGYVVPKRGQVPMTIKENVDEPKSKWVVELGIDGRCVFVTDIMPNDKVITCGGEQRLGILCSRKEVFALPVPEPRKLRIGAVLSDEFGVCVYDTSGYSVLTV